MRRRRRRSLGYQPTILKRTPLLVWLVLVGLCLGGFYLSKQNLVKTVGGQVLDAYSGLPLPGVSVLLSNDKRLSRTAGIGETAKASTDNTGKFEFTQATDSYKLAFSLNNYRPAQLEQTGVFTGEVRLVPTLLRGLVRDEKGQGIPRAQVTLADRTIETSSDGSYSFPDAPPGGQLNVRAPGFRRSSLSFDKSVKVDVALQSFRVKAAYIAPAEIAGPTTFQTVLNSLTPTELTAVVVDIKDESGYVLYDSKVSIAASAIAGPATRIPNLPGLIKTFQDKKLYTIARIVCFQDPVLTDLKPEWTLKSRSTGKAWTDSGGYNWINPYRREAWDYYLGLAEEAARSGFDEVQFVGLHFPLLGNLADIDYALPEGRISNATTRVEAINAFLKAAKDRLAPLGVYTSIRVFGSSLIERGDLNIGMDVVALAPQVDYISPLIYPVEWEPGAFGIDQPIAKPNELVRQALLSAQSRLKERAIQVRPWLQDFSRPNAQYTETQVRDQINAVEEFQAKGGAGWILYNPNSKYSVAAITPKN